MVLLNDVHVPPNSIDGSLLASSAEWEGSFPLGLLAAARDAGPRVCMPSSEAARSFQPCSGRAQTLHWGTKRVPACGYPPDPPACESSKARPPQAHDTPASSRSLPRSACWSLAASSTSEVAGRQKSCQLLSPSMATHPTPSCRPFVGGRPTGFL